MNQRAIFLFTGLALALGGAATALASEMTMVDLALVMNGSNVVFGDHFDNGVIEAYWQQTGSPGPEHDTYVDLHLGDGLGTAFATEPGLETVGLAVLDRPLATPGTYALMLLTGSTPGDILGLAVTENAAFLFDESGPLGTLPMTTPPVVEIMAGLLPDGTGFGLVNDRAVYSGPVSFGPVTGYTITYLPEPSSLVAMAMLLLAAPNRGMRRRPRVHGQ